MKKILNVLQRLTEERSGGKRNEEMGLDEMGTAETGAETTGMAETRGNQT